VPVKVKLPSGTKITQVRQGCDFTVALTSAGSALTWGDNTFGQLGDGTFTERNVPTFAGLPSGVTVTALGAGNRHSLALTSKGQVLAWGVGTSGELGQGSFMGSATPVRARIPANLAVTALGSGPGAGHSMAIVHAR
jgi:alpha-tubulin suppressor-like RCC1 family protein